MQHAKRTGKRTGRLAGKRRERKELIGTLARPTFLEPIMKQRVKMFWILGAFLVAAVILMGAEDCKSKEEIAAEAEARLKRQMELEKRKFDCREEGGRLTVQFSMKKGQDDIYACTYEPFERTPESVR